MRSLKSKLAAVNGTVAARRLAAQWLEAFEEPIVAGVEPPEPFAGTAARLRAVVAGEAELTQSLRSEGVQAVEWAFAFARQHFVRDLFCAAAAAQGYTVEGEFDDWSSSELRLSRPDWRGEHSAEVWVDRRGAFHGHVVREALIEGDEAHLRERIRCAGFNADMASLGRQLAADMVVNENYVPQYAGPVESRLDSARNEQQLRSQDVGE